MLLRIQKGENCMILCFNSAYKKIFRISFCIGISLVINNFYACQTPQDILDFLTSSDTIQMQNVLQNMIYLRTNPISTRPLYSLPSFLITKEPECNSFSATLFYNGTKNVYFDSCNDTSITSVLDVSSLSLEGSGDLFDLLFSTTPFKNINFPLIGDLFDNITVQEHRLGAMFQYGTQFCDNYYFLARVPLLYQIHNVFLEPEIADRFSSELAIPFATFEVSSDKDAVESFILQHLVADQIGLGDADLMIGRTCSLSNNGHLNIAAECIVPLEANFKKGLIGGDFSHISCVFPPFSLYGFGTDLFNPETACFNFEKGFSAFMGIFEAMLDRFTAAIFDKPLGQKHFGLALQSTLEWDMQDCQKVGLFLRGMYQIPRHETRYAASTTPASAFDRVYANNPTQALANLDFLSQQFLYRMLLIPVDMSVSPGIELNAQAYLRVIASDIQLLLGCNGWYQQDEKVSLVSGASTIVSPPSSLFFTEKPACGQVKIFGNIEKLTQMCGCDAQIAVRADVTLFSFGIGKDITLGVSFGTSF